MRTRPGPETVNRVMDSSSYSFDQYAPYEQIAAAIAGPAGNAPARASADGEPWPGRAGATAAGAIVSPGLLAGAVTGFLGAAVALGVANLTAAFVRPQASPLVAAGTVFIDRTPSTLKNFAVAKFGANDNHVLLLGLYVGLAPIAAAIGMITGRRAPATATGIGLFVLFGALVVLTRPASRITDLVPSAVGGAAAIIAVVWLIHAGTQRAGYEPAAYQAAEDELPSYESPGYESPGYESPGYEAPSYDNSGYNDSGYEPHGSPGYEFPGREPYESPRYEPAGQEPLTYGSPAYRAGWPA
jgi:hypothetical protein